MKEQTNTHKIPTKENKQETPTNHYNYLNKLHQDNTQQPINEKNSPESNI